MGNLTSYNGMSYSWNGRELAKIQGGGNTYSYKYNAAGVRVSKTVNGTTTEYFLNGTQILAQKTDDAVMWFFYDSEGRRVGLMNNGIVFYYLYNVQGDVVAIARASTGQVVSRYAYDAWGNCTVTNASGYAVGTKNPFRYRGYYFDTESGLYYLNSRYYSPEFGRFISPDVFISTGQGLLDANMFAYCGDNPVTFRDPFGAKVVTVDYIDRGGGGEDIKKTNAPEIINGQGLEPYKDIRYGISTVGFSGCEAIAVHNALILAGKARSFSVVKANMIRSIFRFGGYGALGLMGGTRSDICNTLDSLHVDYTSASYDELCNVGESTVMIAGFWTTSSAFKGKITYPSIHTVAISYSNGVYTVYNRFNDRSNPYLYTALDSFVNEGDYIYGFIINH